MGRAPIGFVFVTWRGDVDLFGACPRVTLPVKNVG